MKINMNIWSIHGGGGKQSIETPWGSPDVGLKGQIFKAVINILKEQKGNCQKKKLTESMRTISHKIKMSIKR